MVRGRGGLVGGVGLVEAQGLHVSDITDEHLEHFFFVGSDGSPSGLVGLELYGSEALLRSLIVGVNARSKGLGSALIEHAEQYAASMGVRSVYLLTTTAEAYFRRLGYERIDRLLAPTSIKRTREFASLCPARSAFMVKF